MLDATARLIAVLTERAYAGGITVERVGVGSAGVIDALSGDVISATDAILGWAGTAVTTGLAERLDLPPSSVQAVNDVHAHALGEAWTGAAAGTASSLLVAFGTGVGGSYVLEGRPVLGHRHVGGHVGHFASPYAYRNGQPLTCVCGGSGHVEAIASGPAIAEAYQRLGGQAPGPDARSIFALAAHGDAIAIKVISAAAAAAGQAVGGLANILDPKSSWSPAGSQMPAPHGGGRWNGPCGPNSSRPSPTFQCCLQPWVTPQPWSAQPASSSLQQSSSKGTDHDPVPRRP
ncbi:ROK family protein [Arthrobacter sp. SD76]|uniref:ROK family protein n=1 Tax=Arthrobacter sp. SD76 TaxID=3415007 RepID=UPI003C787695